MTYGFSRQSKTREELRAAFKGVMDAITGKPRQVPVDPKPLERTLARERQSLDHYLTELRETMLRPEYNRGKKTATLLQLKQWDALADKIRAGDVGEPQYIGPNGPIAEDQKAGYRYSAARKSAGNIIAANAIYKAVTGRSFDKSGYDSRGNQILVTAQGISQRADQLREATGRAERGETYTQTITTDYAINARDIDGNRASAYWSTPHEMGARAFEAFILDRIADRAQRSDYLVYGAENSFYEAYGMKPYPEGDERKAIDAALGNLFGTIQTRTDAAGNVAMFSRATSASSPEEANALQALSESDEVFALPKAAASTVEGVAREIDAQITVKQMSRMGSRTDYMLTMPDGKTARLIVREPNPFGPDVYGFTTVEGENQDMQTERPGQNPDDVEPTGDVWIDVSLMEPGGGGNKVYAIAAGFAHNTGRIFIGDPAGLSPDAMRRRSENMLSSALRYGTTAHIAPHPEQVRGDVKLGVPPLEWVYGDHLGNIRRLVDLNVNALENAGYDDSSVRFDLATGVFRDSSGSTVDRGAIDVIASAMRAPDDEGADRQLRVQSPQRGARVRADVQTLAGGRTIARGAVWRSLLREEGRESPTGGGRSSLLARLARIGSDAGSPLSGLFSRARGQGISTRDAASLLLSRTGSDGTLPTGSVALPDSSVRSATQSEPTQLSQRRH